MYSLPQVTGQPLARVQALAQALAWFCNAIALLASCHSLWIFGICIQTLDQTEFTASITTFIWSIITFTAQKVTCFIVSHIEEKIQDIEDITTDKDSFALLKTQTIVSRFWTTFITSSESQAVIIHKITLQTVVTI